MLAGILNVALVQVDTNVVRFAEVSRVGAWAASHIENTARLGQIVVLEDGQKLLPGKGSLPETINEGMFEKA